MAEPFGIWRRPAPQRCTYGDSLAESPCDCPDAASGYTLVGPRAEGMTGLITWAEVLRDRELHSVGDYCLDSDVPF